MRYTARIYNDRTDELVASCGSKYNDVAAVQFTSAIEELCDEWETEDPDELDDLRDAIKHGNIENVVAEFNASSLSCEYHVEVDWLY